MKNKAVKVLILIAVSISCQISFAQSNSDKNEPFFTPKRTMFASAILPGSGQIINHQWWKVPVFYAGLTACFYYFNYSRKEYISFRDAYIIRTDDNPLTIDKYDPSGGSYKYRYAEASQLKYYRDSYRRDMEFSIILTTGVYLLNVIDAYVGAHLKNFDLNENLTFSFAPVLSSDGTYFSLFSTTFKF